VAGCLPCADFVEKVVESELWGQAGAFLRKPPYLARPVIRIASVLHGIKRDSGDELCQLPQILSGRYKQGIRRERRLVLAAVIVRAAGSA
jgi:hypothetical protein